MSHSISPEAIAAFKASGQFDEAWYCERYPDVRASGMDPAEHYLWIGQKLGRSCLSPEQRPAHSEKIPAPSFLTGLGDQFPIDFRPFGHTHLKVAVSIHVYYVDLIDEICSYLKNIPSKFTALFSIKDHEMVKEIERSVASYGLNCECIFKVCQNRGRNFGGFLVDFREEVRQHDVVLHIHTKKSLRTGKEQSDWRQYLFDGLLGTRELVSFCLNKFAEDPQIGLIYPETWPGMAIWAHNWLGTSHRVAEICSRLGLDGFRKKGFIDFPVGSMFWASTKALAPLLNYPWEYEHFEAEPIGDEGSLAHVIERSIGEIVRVNGYNYVEMNLQDRFFRKNWSSRLLQNYPENRAGALWVADNAQVLSFDFYDTLFSRLSTTPDDIHNYIGWVLWKRGWMASEADFYVARKAAEAEARMRLPKGDVTLDDIYSFFDVVSSLSPFEIECTKQLEWSIEVKCLVPRQDILDLARSAKRRGARVIIISDSYMPKRFFEHVLSIHGLSDLFDHIYVSSEVERRKDRGDIWEYIKDLEVAGRTFFHFGDNEHSDVQNTVKRDIGHVYLLNTTVLAGLIGLGPQHNYQQSSPAWRDGIVHGPIIARFCSDGFVSRPVLAQVEAVTPEDVGFAVLGPLYFGFLTALISEANRNGSGYVHFLAREGWFFKKAYDLIADRVSLGGGSAPTAKYLHVSRRAVMGAMAVANFEPDFFLRGARFKGALSEFLRSRLGLDGLELFGIADRQVDTEHDRLFLKDFFANNKVSIESYLSNRYKNCQKYLMQNNFLNGNDIVVDLGYSGTIQSALQNIVGHGVRGFYMVTSESIDDVSRRGGNAKGYFSDRYSPCVTRNYSMILEALLTAPHGQTRDYTANGELAEPVFGPNGYAQNNFDYLERIQDGAMQYLSQILDTYGPEVAMTTYSPRECEWGLQALVDGKLTVPDGFWAMLNVEDDFCGNGELNIKALYGL